jgi:hypothetical protein
VSIPIVFVGQSFVDAVIEVFVVREDDVAANIIQLPPVSRDLAQTDVLAALTNPSFVTSVEARPPGVSFESMIIQDGPF